MQKKGAIVGKQILISLIDENPEIEVAHFHEHGGFFYYSQENLLQKTDYYWVEDKSMLDKEKGIIKVTELIPFSPNYEERCEDCSSVIPSGEIRYRIPYTRCQPCLNKLIR